MTDITADIECDSRIKTTPAPTNRTAKIKAYFSAARTAASTTAHNLYNEFNSKPVYYISSAAMRVAVGVGVGYAVSYGLTTFVAAYMAPIQVLASPAAQPLANMMQQLAGSPLAQQMLSAMPTMSNLSTVPGVIPNSMSYVAGFVPHIIFSVSTLSGLLGATKLSNELLSRLFGEVELTARVTQRVQPSKDHKIETEQPVATLHETSTKSDLLLSILFGNVRLYADLTSPETKESKPYLIMAVKDRGMLIDRPYITPLSEITAQLEKRFIEINHDKPLLLEKSKTFALAYTRLLVIEHSGRYYQFGDKEKAEVNTEKYISAAKSIKL